MTGWRRYCRPSRGNPYARDLGSEFMIGSVAVPVEAIQFVIMFVVAYVGIVAIVAGGFWFDWWIAQPLPSGGVP